MSVEPISDDELSVARDWAARGMFDPPNPTVTIKVGSLIARIDASEAERDAFKERYAEAIQEIQRLVGLYVRHRISNGNPDD